VRSHGYASGPRSCAGTSEQRSAISDAQGAGSYEAHARNVGNGVTDAQSLLFPVRSQRRVRISTFCEVFGPALILAQLTGFQAAMRPVDFPVNLHLHHAQPNEAALAVQALGRCSTIEPSTSASFCPGVMGDQLIDRFGGNAWNATSAALQLFYRPSTNNLGLQRVQTLQFLPVTDDPGLSTIVQDLVQTIQQQSPLLAAVVRADYPDEMALDVHVSSRNYGFDGRDRVFGAVVLNAGSPRWSYSIRQNVTLRLNSSSTIDTNVPTLFEQVLFDADAHQVLLQRGAHLLQHWVDTFILEREWNTSTTQSRPAGARLERSMYLQPFPTPPYSTNAFSGSLATTFGFTFMLALLWPVTRLVKDIVEEKQRRIKEGMLVMGLQSSAHWAAWFATYSAMFLVTSIMIGLVTLGLFKHSTNGLIIMSVQLVHTCCSWACRDISDEVLMTIVFLLCVRAISFFLFFLICCFSLCWLLAVFFDRSSVATTATALLFLGMFFVSLPVNAGPADMDLKAMACLSAPLCLGLGTDVLLRLEALHGGVTLKNANLLLDGWSYNKCIGMFVLDTLLYSLLALYFSQVVPSAWGTTRKPWFFLLRSYWYLDSVHPSHDHVPLTQSRLRCDNNVLDPTCFEPVSDLLRGQLAVEIKGLRKEFIVDGSDPQVAVAGLDLQLYSGQIFSLLGHNGAGKTTTISMLTGMIPPTSGDARVCGLSVSEDMLEVRKRIGVCPQHNILFDLLTVKEHLELYGAIKQVAAAELEAHVTDLISQVGLTEKTNDLSLALSGGQKRKLSVAIALLGDSKVVFLDEPTSGMDPYSRRSIWEMLRNIKQGRAIVLTTHFMDEADQLGDRIGIMQAGSMTCCGSSLFLKKRYGVGYTLTVTKIDARFDETATVRAIRTAVPDVLPLSNIAAEASFRLPFAAAPQFGELFDHFDAHKAALGIDSYTIAVTTLEEVFLRVAREQHEGLSAAVPSPELSVSAPLDLQEGCPEIAVDLAAGSCDLAVIHGRASPSCGAPMPVVSPSNNEPALLLSPAKADVRFQDVRVSGEAQRGTFVRHVRALLWKRFLNARRDRRVWCWTLLYPLAVLLLGCGLIAPANPSLESTDLVLSPASLNQGTANYVPVAATLSSAVLFHDTADGSAFVPIGHSALNQTSVAARRSVTQEWLLDTLYPDVSQSFSRYNALEYNIQADGAGNLLDEVTVFFNTTAQWSSLLGVSVYDGALLRYLSGNSDASIQVHLHPLQQTLATATPMTNALTAVVVTIAFAFLPSLFVSYAVKEQEDTVKHQQLISGVSPLSYWAANFLWDFANYLPMLFMALLVFRIYSIDAWLGDATGYVFLATLLYGLSVIPFAYMLSFLFTSSTSAQNGLLLLSILGGAMLLVVSVVLTILEATRPYVYYAKFGFRLLPMYSFGECLMNIMLKDSGLVFQRPRDLNDVEVIGWPMLVMTGEIFVCTAVVLLIEHCRARPSLTHCCGLRSSTHNALVADSNAAEDADVRRERQRLHAPGSGQTDAIQIRGLHKVFQKRGGVGAAAKGTKVAVKDLWLGIPEGQCFGFLGINGAGKTTTLSMLTNDLFPTAGTAQLGGFDILSQQGDVRRLLGYCPQFDALLEMLTAREHLQLFARIKGVREEILTDYVEHILGKLGLQEGIADKPSKGYSGGNKRKLCVGIALIGNPPIVFLDEPSTGMDPVSRRSMWDLISSTMAHRSVVLTTHSMEECEALAQRVGIMVGGSLRCIGSTAHLKATHGNAFQLDVNVQVGVPQDAFRAALAERWPQAQLIEQHGNATKFRLPRSIQNTAEVGVPASISIGALFRYLEQVKEQFSVQQYSISETTLEQVFNSFAAQQEEETGLVVGMHIAN
jgi:ATP-binding cassette subfamily A (ABC1) protein 3